MKVFLDTNDLISAFTTRGLSADLFRLLLAEHELMTGEVNLVEFRRVLQQRFGVPDVEIGFAETLLREQTVVPGPEAVTNGASVPCRSSSTALTAALAERFLKEIEVTANLQHPHILPLHDSGEADSFLYYVMPYSVSR